VRNRPRKEGPAAVSIRQAPPPSPLSIFNKRRGPLSPAVLFLRMMGAKEE